MAYQGFPFPPGTPLYPSHEHIQAYHLGYAKHLDSLQYIRLNRRVESASWLGNVTRGKWKLNLTINGTEKVIEKTHDHLIVASGNNHIPHVVTWRGQEEWLSTGYHDRNILHSVYYQGPQAFSNQNVLVVGSGGSGRVVVLQVRHYAKKVSQLSDFLGISELT